MSLNDNVTPYLRAKQLQWYVPFSLATIWRKAANGTFPAPIKLSARVTVWSRAEVEAWLKSKETK